DIVIPEMVSKEAGGILAERNSSGKGNRSRNDLDNYFDYENDYFYPQKPEIRRFLTNVDSGEYKGIHIERSDGDKPYARYLNAMHAAIDQKFPDNYSPKSRRAIINRSIVQVNEEWDTTNFGEQHANDIILRMLKQKEEPPSGNHIFFFTMDGIKNKKDEEGA